MSGWNQCFQIILLHLKAAEFDFESHQASDSRISAASYTFQISTQVSKINRNLKVVFPILYLNFTIYYMQKFVYKNKYSGDTTMHTRAQGRWAAQTPGASTPILSTTKKMCPTNTSDKNCDVL